jgi:hypothetical protein
MDYSLLLPGSATSKFQAADEIRPLLGNTFTVAFWVYALSAPAASSGFAKLLDLGGGNGVIFDGAVHGWLDGDAQTPAPNATALNMWHHVAFVADGTTASFYYDLSDKFGFGGASSSRSFAGFSAGGPTLLDFGFGFHGYIDEVKMWARVIGLEEFKAQHLALARETASEPTNVAAYYRFNALTEYMDEAFTVAEASGEAVMAGSTVGGTYVPMAVPWEPSTMETVNGVDVKTKFDVFKQPMTGMANPLQVTGFNFAESFATGCFWGDEADMKVPAFAPGEERQPDQCPAPNVASGEELDLNELDTMGGENVTVPEGALGYPGGLPAAMFPYPAFVVNGSLFRPAAVSGGGTALSCPSPAMDSPAFAMFSAGNTPTLTTYPFEFAEVALGCAGDNHVEADAVSALAAGAGGYTFGAWVLPQSTPTAAPAASSGGAGRRLLATEGGKTLRRRLAGHEVSAEPQTVLAFESSDAEEHADGRGHKALLMYDAAAAAFLYYDDCILDVRQRSAAAADEWHFVMVSVGEHGEALLLVDGVVEERFTTQCRPQLDGLFSMCADYAFPGGSRTAGSHFTGHVDEVRVFDQPLGAEAMAALMFSASADPEAVAPVAYFPFRTHEEMLPLGAVATAGTKSFVTSSGPWFPATVVGVEPEVAGVAGGATVSVFGANIAPSRFLRVNFGGDDAPASRYLGVSGVAAVVPPLAVPGQAKAVAVRNARGVPNVTLFDTRVLYAPTVLDLDVGLVSRVTFTSGHRATRGCGDCAPCCGGGDCSASGACGACRCGLPPCLSPCLPHCVSLTVCLSPCLPHCVSLTVCLSPCLPHYVSLTVSPSLCVSHRVSLTMCLHRVSLTMCLSPCLPHYVSPSLCLSHRVSLTVCLSPCLPRCVSLTVSPTLCVSHRVSLTVSPSLCVSHRVSHRPSPCAAPATQSWRRTPPTRRARPAYPAWPAPRAPHVSAGCARSAAWRTRTCSPTPR